MVGHGRSPHPRRASALEHATAPPALHFAQINENMAAFFRSRTPTAVRLEPVKGKKLIVDLAAASCMSVRLPRAEWT